MVLLNTLMPANTHYFLEYYLSWLRWYSKDFEDKLKETFDYKSYNLDFGAYHMLLQDCGFNHLLASNMVIILIVLLILLLVWAIIAIVDLTAIFTDRPKTKGFEGGNLERPKKRMQKTLWCQNFILRFCYEFFLVFCVCVFLQLSVTDFRDFSPTFQFILALVIFFAVVILIVFVVRLFFCRGPWVPGYYTKKTALHSIEGVRKRSSDFDYQKWLKDHPKDPVKPWGRFVVTCDMNKLCFWRKR